MTPNSSIEKTLAITLVTGSLIAFLGWALFLYVITGEAGETVSILGEVKTRLEEEKALTSIRALANDAGGNMALLDQLFVKETEIASFVETIEEGARTDNVTIEISTLSLDSDKTKAIRPLSARVDAEGSWKNIISFITDIEGLPRAVSLDHIALTKSESDAKDSGGLWKATFEVITYVIQ